MRITENVQVRSRFVADCFSSFFEILKNVERVGVVIHKLVAPRLNNTY